MNLAISILAVAVIRAFIYFFHFLLSIPFSFCSQQLVESVLSKVVEEFEHRIASQYQMVF